jgi:transposase InsO family protein
MGGTSPAFLRRALAWYAAHGITTRALLTDNGSCYLARSFAGLCSELGIRHARTRPYRPRTNGKAERFIQTLLREWAYGFTYPASSVRTQRLLPYLHFYNYHRAHTSLGRNPPISRLGLNNVVRNNS